MNALLVAALGVGVCREAAAQMYGRRYGATPTNMNTEHIIEFEHPLPRMFCDGKPCGLYNNPELSLPGVLTATDYRLGAFLQRLRETIMANRRLLFVDGRVIVCNHNWIRDHVQQMKGWMHWEYDPISFLQYIIDTQRADGQFFELVKQMDDEHWKMVDEDCRRLFPDDNQSLVRLELEADVEYLVVEGAWQYYRMTGGSISENAGPSAWGAAALMSAVDEGLAGVVNAGTGYDEIDFSPRWPVTHYREVRHVTGYELTKKYVDVRCIMTDKGMRYNVRGPAKTINAHILLPEGRGCRKLLVNGADAPFADTAVDQSRYVDCSVAADGEVDFEVLF